MGVEISRILAASFSRLALALLLWAAAAEATAAQAQEGPGSARVPVYVFWGDGCPHCATQKPFLDELAAAHPQVEVRSFEVWYEVENRRLFSEIAARVGVQVGGVPTTVIGDRAWIGFHEGMKREMESAVISCIRAGCVDMGAGLVGTPEAAPQAFAPPASAPRDPPPSTTPPAVPTGPDPRESPLPGGPSAEGPSAPGAPSFDEPSAGGALPDSGDTDFPADGATDETLRLPLVGTVSLSARSLPMTTALIAFVDGFNPCSLWVLSILLALVLHTGSRKKIALVGATFLLVTASVYALFIVGLFRIFTVIDYLGPVQTVVALLAMGFAIVNIKDYFWYGKGVSFSISDRHKPKIYRDFRGLLTPGRSTGALIGATVVMALGIALIELPCTAGFPVLWSNLLAGHGVSTGEFSLLLAIYMTVYLLDELVVFGTAVFTLRMSRMEEKHGRVLKLVGGMVMLALALVLLLDPGRMNTFGGSLEVFGAAIAATLIILLVHRWILPRSGLAARGEPK